MVINMSEINKIKHKISTRHIGGGNLPDRIYRSLIRQAVVITLRSESVDIPCVINVLITDNNGIKDYNNKYRGLNRITDVLSFPMQNYSHAGWGGIFDIDIDMDTNTVPLGDIIISVMKIKQQARVYGNTLEHETVRMIIHSTLHLLGYDHIKTNDRELMESKEEILVKYMGYF